jgi:uncharacterized protein
MSGINVAAHGYDHFIDVWNHSTKALKHEQLSDRIKLQIELAALLHDADDRKIFRKRNGNSDSLESYPNAREILKKTITDDDKEQFIQEIIDMISLVSCSENGDSEPPYPWMAIPRDCDRLEAIGEIGIKRCTEFITERKAAFHLETTIRALTKDQVEAAATSERFAAYMKGARSVSMIDHYYDKLLHIGKPHCLRSQNPYILEEAARRNNVMTQFVIDYWTSNQ